MVAPKSPGKKPAVARSATVGGQATSGSLSPGVPAPQFELPDDVGGKISLASLSGKRVVLFFYPKDNTPGCTREACGFQAALSALAGKGAVVLGVSRDSPRTHAGFKVKQGLAYPLLSDPEGAVHRAYGAWGKKVLYGRESEGCIRTTVLIDSAGHVARIFSPVKVDGHADEVLAALGAVP
jgi:thioredoxin-dependent peroxiredoxin